MCPLSSFEISKLESAHTLNDYCKEFLNGYAGVEFALRTKAEKPLQVLDIGFGLGESSLYLASLGHDVSSIDPSPLNCELLEKAAAKYQLLSKISIYQGTAENFDYTNENKYDLCVFNSSLHHCYDPQTVLKNCKNILKINGKVLITNEPILKFFRTKKWYYKNLQENPVKFGHYGGNEHIYYYHEYETMLREAGFKAISSHFHSRHMHPRIVVGYDIGKKINESYVHSDHKLLAKFTFLIALKKLMTWQLTKRLTITAGKKLSLFPYTFEALKL